MPEGWVDCAKCGVVLGERGVGRRGLFEGYMGRMIHLCASCEQAWEQHCAVIGLRDLNVAVRRATEDAVCRWLGTTRRGAERESPRAACDAGIEYLRKYAQSEGDDDTSNEKT